MVDPRAKSKDQIPAPWPLPYISRKALGRIKAPAPIPTKCPYCNSEVKLMPNSVIYSGTSYGDWPYAYLCRSCKAYVGVHPYTDIPLGTLADRDLREARKNSKAYFMELSRRRAISRTKMYAWLAEEMDLDADECHFGWFNTAQCTLAGKICLTAIKHDNDNDNRN